MFAEVGEPLVLADGTKIDTATGKKIKQPTQYVEVPRASEAQAIIARTKRSINELPLQPGAMNVVSLVLFYTMWGLQSQDIAVALNLTKEQIENIRGLEQYKTISDDIKKSVLDHEANDIRSFFQNKAHDAARKIVEHAESDNDVLSFKASQDVLDRAGFRPADVVEHKHSMQDSLKIEFIDRTKERDIPTLETSYRDVTP